MLIRSCYAKAECVIIEAENNGAKFVVVIRVAQLLSLGTGAK